MRMDFPGQLRVFSVYTITENIFEGWKSALSGVLETSTVNLHVLHCTMDTVRWSCWWAALDVTHFPYLALPSYHTISPRLWVVRWALQTSSEAKFWWWTRGKRAASTPAGWRTLGTWSHFWKLSCWNKSTTDPTRCQFPRAPTAETEGHCFSYVIATVVHACKYMYM